MQELTIRELTALRHQSNHHWLSHLKKLHIDTKSHHPNNSSLPSLPKTIPGNICTQPFSTPPLPVESPQTRFPNTRSNISYCLNKAKYFPVYQLPAANTINSQSTYTQYLYHIPIICYSSQKVWGEAFCHWGYARESWNDPAS